MAKIHTISLSDEASNRLKEVPNKSGLIDCLLINYFQTNSKDPEALKKRLTEEKAKKEEILKQAEENINKITLEVKNVEFLEEQKQAEEFLKEQRKLSRIANFINMVRDDGFEISEIVADEYFKRFDQGEINYGQFLAGLENERKQSIQQN